MVLKNVGCPRCGSIVSFSIEGCEEVTSVRRLNGSTDLERFDLDYSTECKPCPGCEGKIAVHYRSRSKSLTREGSV
jgi:DNA-directed RNA polymerase subunit RPC12/RpoP